MTSGEGNGSSRDHDHTASVKLTENQREVLGNAASADRTHPGLWLRPMDMGGTDASHHSATAARLAARGLLERYDHGSITRRRAVWNYRITEAGRAALSPSAASASASTPDEPHDL